MSSRRFVCSRETAEEALEAIMRVQIGYGYHEHREPLLEALVHYDPAAINRIIPHLTFRQCFWLQHVLYMRTSIANKLDKRYPRTNV